MNNPNPPGIDRNGNVYIPDDDNHRIRKVDINTGIITTIAGTGIVGFSGDNGPATAAMIYDASSIDFDKNGNLFFADGDNFRIRKIDANGIISTIMGTGLPGFSGDGGPATLAQDSGIVSIKFDAVGNLFLTGSRRVRKIDTFGIITTVAGNVGSGIYNGDNIPATNAELDAEFGLAIDNNGNLYVADQYNNRIRRVNASGMITTVVGTGFGGYNGDGITASVAQIFHPEGLALDACGNLYIADSYNYRIRKVYFNPDCWPVEVEHIPLLEGTDIYPNPVISILHIDALTKSSTYRIVNMIGATQQQGTLRPGQNTIPVQTLPPGMYMLEVITDAQRTVHKVIKQ